MPAKAHKISHEMEIASLKRAHSDSDDSDFEEEPPAKRPKVKKPVQNSTQGRISETLPKGHIAVKLPKWAECTDGVKPLSTAWWKEITARDAFWQELKTRTPKSVMQKRLSVNIAVNLDKPEIKEDQDEIAPRAVKGSKKSAISNRDNIKPEHLVKKEPAFDLDSDDDEFDKEAISIQPSEMMRRNLERADKSPEIVIDTDDEEGGFPVYQSTTLEGAQLQNSPRKSTSASTPTQETRVAHSNDMTDITNGDARKTIEEDTIIVASAKPVQEVELLEHAAGEPSDVVETIEEVDRSEDSAPASQPVTGSWQPKGF